MGHTSVSLGHVEVADVLLVQADVPPDFYVVLRLRLLQLLVVIGLQLDQRTEYVLVLVTILVPDDKHKSSTSSETLFIEGGGVRRNETGLT